MVKKTPVPLSPCCQGYELSKESPKFNNINPRMWSACQFKVINSFFCFTVNLIRSDLVYKVYLDL